MKAIKRYDNALAKMNEVHEYIPELVDSDDLFTAYRKSCNRGLDLIDFDGPVWDDKIGVISDAMKVHDVTKFTISSGYSGIADTIAAFTERGWELVGMTKVDSGYTDWEFDYKTRASKEVARMSNAFVLAR